MTETKQKIHCLHICGHLDAFMEEAANKKFEERQQAVKPPIQCSTNEGSEQLHEMYKDRVQNTEPSEEKKKMIEDWMQSIEDAKLAHSLILQHAKEEEIGVKRHPSTLSHMHHDDSDSEYEDSNDMPEAPSGTTGQFPSGSAINEAQDDVITNQSCDTPETARDGEVAASAPVMTTASQTSKRNEDELGGEERHE